MSVGVYCLQRRLLHRHNSSMMMTSRSHSSLPSSSASASAAAVGGGASSSSSVCLSNGVCARSTPSPSMDAFDRNHRLASPDSPDIDIDDTPSCTSDDDDDDDIDDDDDNNGSVMRGARKDSLASSCR